MEESRSPSACVLLTPVYKKRPDHRPTASA
jgi:hypothetical protein